MNATFFERVGAYLVDMLIVSFIVSMIFLGFGNTTSDKENAMMELDNKLATQEITITDYIDEYAPLLYDVQKEKLLESGITVAFIIAYFVVFQYMNQGQTIGKKVFNLRVVDKDSKQPITILKGLLRSFIVFSILSGILLVILLYILNSKNYMYSYLILLFIEGLFTLTTIMLILYKKDKRGLHDLMANTIVIKESR